MISGTSVRFLGSALEPSCPDASIARLNEANSDVGNDMSNGAELLVDALVQRGIETIFGFPGDTSIAFYDVLSRRTADIRHVLARQGCGQSRFSCSQVCCETEEGEEQVVVVFGFADGGGDVLVAGLADEAHDEVTESGKGAGAGSGPDLGRVLAEGDIADKVDWTSHCSLTVGVRLEQAFLGGG